MEQSEIMSSGEAAKFLGVSEFTLRAYAKGGQIPSAKIGRLWRFRKADLIEHIRSQYKVPMADAKERPEV